VARTSMTRITCTSSFANCAKKIEVDPTRPRILLTKLGVGYCLVQ